MIIFLQIFLCLIFLVICYICFGVPGRLLTSKLKIFDNFFEAEIVAIGVGVCVFALVVYLLAMMGQRDLIWLYVGIGFAGFVYRLVNSAGLLQHVVTAIKSKSIIFWAVLLIGIVGQVAVNAPSGMRYMDGIYFWSSHGHDGVWHIALMDEFQKLEWPLQNPELSGERLINYHFFSDLEMSELARLFKFDNLDVYFRFMPVFNSIMLGLSAFLLVRKLSRSELGGIWAMFFVYFAGSFGFFVSLARSGNLVGESIFWISQTQSVLGNPPHAMAFYILMIYLLVLVYWFKKNSLGLAVILVILGGALIEFKVYAGLLVLGGLLVTSITQILLKRDLRTTGLFIATAVLASLVYLPNSNSSEGFLVWHPWWFIRTMVVAPDRLNLIDWEYRRQTYIADHNWKRVVLLEGTAFLIFLFGNLGVRLIGFWSVVKIFKNKFLDSYFNQFFMSMVLASFFIPVFFLQKGVAWNAIQFTQYFLLLFGLLAGWSCADLKHLIKQKWLKYVLVSGIVILAIPTQIGLLWQFYGNKPLSNVSHKELEVLNYLRQNSLPESIVLTKYFDRYEADKYPNPPIPIYAWYGTGYVSAFSSRRTLIADVEQVQIMGYSKDQLIKDREKAFDTNDPIYVGNFLATNHIDYVYLSYEENFKAPINKLPLILLAGNSDARLYKVIK